MTFLQRSYHDIEADMTKDIRIPMLDLTGEIEELWDELSNAVLRVLRSGQFVLGPEVEAFEREAAEYLGVKHAVGLNSGTDALVIGLRALGVGPGDEVITTSFSFFATAEAIINVGASPVFVDVREDSFNIDPDLIEAAITERTKALLPVHLFGNPAAMTKITAIASTHGLKVLEDCAQSFGAVYHGDSEGDENTPDRRLIGRKTGSLGDAGAFSFYPTKNLGAYGDGGMLATNDDDVARLARMLRNHGASLERRYENEMPGYNSRLDEIQAAVLRVKLPRVDGWNSSRRDAAERYGQELFGMPGVIVPKDSDGHVYHQFTIRVKNGKRTAARQALEAAGLASAVFYPASLRRLIDKSSSSHASPIPVAEQLATEVMSLPIWPGLGGEVPRVLGEALRTVSSQ
ncbi:MAG: DegT/DnrJ/EryC1/StrS family aminotransferase [Trueperaceae bacterium]